MGKVKIYGGKAVDWLKKIQYNSPVILTFTLLSFAVLLLSLLTGNKSTVYLFSVYRSSLADPLFYIRLCGHALGHIDYHHFYNNILIILMVGPMLEEKYGSKNMLIMITGTALITGIIHIVFFNNVMLLGASGIVFMFILLSSYVNLSQGRIPLTLILCVIVFIGGQVAEGISNTNPGVSQFGHILGGLSGASFGFFFNKNKLIT